VIFFAGRISDFSGGGWRRETVAQLCKLLYRRFATCGAKPALRQIENLRYAQGNVEKSEMRPSSRGCASDHEACRLSDPLIRKSGPASFEASRGGAAARRQIATQKPVSAAAVFEPGADSGKARLE